MKVSVIVPAYNAEGTIEKCLVSIMKQTYQEIEIIVVDDGSMDKTVQYVELLQESDERIRLICQENAGASAARNKGTKAAAGEFLVFVDADDEIACDMLADLIKVQEKYQADLVKSAICRISEDGSECILAEKDQKIYCSKEEWKKDFFELLANELNSPVGKLYKKEIIEKYSISFNEGLELSEDLHFNLDYLEKINKVVCLPKAYYRYYLANSQVTTKYREKLFLHRKTSIDLFDLFLARNDIQGDIIHYLYIKLLLSDAINEREHGINKKQRILNIDENLRCKEVVEALEKCVPKGMIQKIICTISRTKNAYIIDAVCGVMLACRSNKLFSSARKISV